MPDKIHLLPDSVANQIAAGEVIQRPASVIKELVENAVDAKADDIRIYIKDAGRTLIQVIDNGMGMSDTDTRMAFERHATSKISAASDLSALTTMGFRGEALPSICAISQVEVRSRLRESPMGTHLAISGSRVEFQRPDLCDTGTNFMVKNLFYNVPARRKFMKSDSVELSNIMREFERLALVNPGVKMSIDTGGKRIELRKGTLLQRIGELWKGPLVEQLIPVEAETPLVKISGFVSRPEFARRRNALQFFLVNGRNMRHPYFKKAVLNCFNGLIAPDTMPCFFIKFELDPSSIDVNIHPTKDEIKFEEETLIWSVLTAAVKASLGKNAAVPSIDFESDTLPVESLTPEQGNELPGYDIPLDYNPFASAARSSGTRKKNETHTEETGQPGSGKYEKGHNPATNWESLYDGFMKAPSREAARDIPLINSTPDKPELPEMAANGPEIEGTLQFDDKYIIASIEGQGVAVIDQYRAHVKILYEQMIRRMSSTHPVSQALLFPALLELSHEQDMILAEIAEPLRKMGMHIEKEGVDYAITGVPPGVTADMATEIVVRIIETISDESSHYGAEAKEDPAQSLRKNIALSTARSMAVKRGRRLTEEERREIVKDLFSLPDPSLTPAGRRIYTLLTAASIEKLLP